MYTLRPTSAVLIEISIGIKGFEGTKSKGAFAVQRTEPREDRGEDIRAVEVAYTYVSTGEQENERKKERERERERERGRE